MKEFGRLLLVLLMLLAWVIPVQAKKPAEDPVPNPDPGQKEFSAVPNLSFPMIATDIIDIFYQKVWIEDDLEGEDGYGEVSDGEWHVGYDSVGDGVIDNTIGDGVPIAIGVDDSITDPYGGDYPGNTGFYYQTYVVTLAGTTEDVLTQYWDDDDIWTSIDGSDGKADLTDPIDMVTWYQNMEPWYDQPVNMDTSSMESVTSFDGLFTVDINSADNPNNIWNVTYLDGGDIGGENSWQAEWRVETENTIYIDFIDWGNPLENTVAPIVGQRFPVEMALFAKVGSSVENDAWGTPMTANNVGCIERPSTRDEVFGTSTLGTGSFSKEVFFATVMTKSYFAEVWDPAGGITPIPIEPGIGPSGKINYASAGGGWIPTMTGWHRIWMHFNDPLVSLEGAIVNNDEHYILTTGFMAEELNKNKLALVGIVGDSTFVDVYVYPPSGNKPKR